MAVPSELLQQWGTRMQVEQWGGTQLVMRAVDM